MEDRDWKEINEFDLLLCAGVRMLMGLEILILGESQAQTERIRGDVFVRLGSVMLGMLMQEAQCGCIIDGE